MNDRALREEVETLAARLTKARARLERVKQTQVGKATALRTALEAAGTRRLALQEQLEAARRELVVVDAEHKHLTQQLSFDRSAVARLEPTASFGRDRLNWEDNQRNGWGCGLVLAAALGCVASSAWWLT